MQGSRLAWSQHALAYMHMATAPPAHVCTHAGGPAGLWGQGSDSHEHGDPAEVDAAVGVASGGEGLRCHW